MSEPMVRVLSVICERHGSADNTSRGRLPILATRTELSAVRCRYCESEAKPYPHPLRFATEPVDLEPREEQAG